MSTCLWMRKSPRETISTFNFSPLRTNKPLSGRAIGQINWSAHWQSMHVLQHAIIPTPPEGGRLSIVFNIKCGFAIECNAATARYHDEKQQQEKAK